jgi:hypothetical protein
MDSKGGEARVKTLYCWRCGYDVPMLDEEEFAVLQAIYHECVEAVKEYRRVHDAPLSETPLDELYRPVLDHYERLTGLSGFEPMHLLKHRISRLGPPCTNCGTPLRTPEAKMCVRCGARRGS